MKDKILRIILGIIHLVLALNAFGGGAYGMMGAKEVPAEWLAGSMFSSYFIPSMFLFVVIGGSCLLAAILLFRDAPSAKRMCFITASLLLVWIAAQLAIIGYVSWLQPAVAISAIVVLLLAFLLNTPDGQNQI